MGNTQDGGERESIQYPEIPEQNRIDTVRTITPEKFMNEYYLKDKPLVITHMMDDWPVLQKWTLDYIKQEIGEQTHTFRYEHGARIQMKVKDYIDIGTSFGEKKFQEIPSKEEQIPYLRHFGPLSQLAPQLQKDVLIENLFPSPDKVYFREFIFVGVPLTKTNCHFDTSSNFVAIAVGQKHVTLLPPQAEKEMDLDDKSKGLLAESEAHYFPDPENMRLDLTKEAKEGAIHMHQHPVFAHSPKLYYSPLKKGEIVFIPQYWYHYIHNIDMSVSITVQTSLH